MMHNSSRQLRMISVSPEAWRLMRHAVVTFRPDKLNFACGALIHSVVHLKAPIELRRHTTKPEHLPLLPNLESLHLHDIGS